MSRELKTSIQNLPPKRKISYGDETEIKSLNDDDHISSFSIDRREERRRSKYDLPLQYHEDALKKSENYSFNTSIARKYYQTSLASIRTNEHYSVVWDDETPKSSFRYLKTEVLQKVLEQKTQYSYITKMALKKLKCDIFKQLRILYNHTYCQSNKQWPMDEVPRDIFRWSREDFLQRRQYRSDVWIDILLRDRSEECLHFYKYQTDTNELIKYLKSIFQGFLIDDPFFDSEKLFNKTQDVYYFLKAFRNLLKEYIIQEKLFQAECNKVLALSFQKRDSKHRYKQLLEEQLMIMEFLDPIELRYQLRYYNNKATQSEIKCENLEIEYLNKIENLKKDTQREHYCSQCASNSMYIDIENFKTRITLMSEQYDKDYEAIDNKIQYNRLTIEKIRDQRKFMEEQIERFHEEIELMEARTIAEKAEEERQVMERLEAELRKKEAKLKKKQEKAMNKKQKNKK